VPFAYYARLSRSQQAVYRKSDALLEIRLENPASLRPRVTALEAALNTEERAATERASRELVDGLTSAMGLPNVKVEVLAARPHSHWGELHGLYTYERGRQPKIQLWMRTAKRKRVVAFRTYLRTLLHEVGHHVDYTLLRLPDSYHTEGFYKRESSLFYQLVPEAHADRPARTRRSREEWAIAGWEECLARLERAPDELARLMRGNSDAALSRRPAPDAWSAKEVVCHLRDAEEHLAGWIGIVLANPEPVLIAARTAARWATDRQYQRQHAGAAWEAFGRRRDETLALLRGLTPAQRDRGGVHPSRGRMTVDNLVALMAWHDDDLVDQLRRALAGEA
jgi:hypothetical protein